MKEFILGCFLSIMNYSWFKGTECMTSVRFSTHQAPPKKGSTLKGNGSKKHFDIVIAVESVSVPHKVEMEIFGRHLP